MNMKFLKKKIKSIPAIKKFVGYHNPGLYDVLSQVGLLNSQIKMVIDVGANTGQTIAFFREFTPNAIIYSFEPTKMLVNDLKTRYGKDKSVNIIDIALSDSEGSCELYTSSFSATNSLLKPDVGLYKEFYPELSIKLSNSNSETCKIDTFNNWYTNNLKDSEIDIMKIDVQGAEYNVIKGGVDIIRNNVKAVIIEIQYQAFYKDCVPFYEVLKILYENGYYLYTLFDANKKSNLQLLENNVLLLNKKFFNESI